MKNLFFALAVVIGVGLMTNSATAGRRHYARHHGHVHSHHAHHGHGTYYAPRAHYAPRVRYYAPRVQYYAAPYYTPYYPTGGSFHFHGPRVNIGIGW